MAQTMARKLTIILYVALMLVLITANQAESQSSRPQVHVSQLAGLNPPCIPGPHARCKPPLSELQWPSDHRPSSESNPGPLNSSISASFKYGAKQGSLHPQECGSRCTMRCSATAYKKPCMFFCQKCCAKCLCVPPGTYGNKQLCPCYNNWKTKRGGPKCP
ncbi:uncharacterized protein LOC141619294 [Silene latifolia]|uniref:uncharacterized protein LOC141619294 n=1 Tax=Silene latifolia TaxID=37657 RepID=UPI003D76AB95